MTSSPFVPRRERPGPVAGSRQKNQSVLLGAKRQQDAAAAAAASAATT